MNKILIMLIAVSVMSFSASAADNFIIDEHNTYKILNEITSSYSSKGQTFSVKYMVLENETEINSLESKEADLNFSITRASFESRKLENENRKSEESIEKNTIILSGIETEKNETTDVLAKIETKKRTLESTLNSAVLISPGSYNIGIAIFIIILILAVTMKSRSMLLKGNIDMKKKSIEKERSGK